MKTYSLVVAVLVAATTVMTWGCSRTHERLGSEIGEPPAQFGTPDAGPDGARDPRELIAYCPSDECPTGYTTCPLSNFRCDVNLLTDRNNCGACGVVCPTSDKGAAFECVDGKCALQCKMGYGDCDGIVDNGCESTLSTDDSCKFCGNKCAADSPCIWRDDGYGCGCPDGETPCSNGFYVTCLDTSIDDRNCGACGNACDPRVIEQNTYEGCFGSTCGHLKCISEWGDCDAAVGNGCETRLNTNENCGGCGRACSPDEQCRYVQYAWARPIPMCTCASGESFCAFSSLNGLPVGRCYDLRTDVTACGACGAACSSGERCDFGVCRLDCAAGTDDCNGSKVDECEVNTNADPNNCGGCGIKCDGVAGQACVGGRCVVKPCDAVDAGGGPAR